MLRSLRRVFPDPHFELAQIARTLTADRPVNAQLDPWAEKWRIVDTQLDAWAEKWGLKQLREDAKFHVLLWAVGPKAAADQVTLHTTRPALPRDSLQQT